MVRVMSDSADVALFAELMLAKTNPRAQTDDIRTPLKNRVKVGRRRRPPLHRDSARPCHICTGTGHTSATHLHRDWAHPCHICTGTRLTRAACCMPAILRGVLGRHLRKAGR